MKHHILIFPMVTIIFTNIRKTCNIRFIIDMKIKSKTKKLFLMKINFQKILNTLILVDLKFHLITSF